jgi:hypothetical protein
MQPENPYQDANTAASERVVDSHRRSSVLAGSSLVVAILIGTAILATQHSFARMYLEFEITLPLVSSVACWGGLPILLLVVASVAFLIGYHPRIQPLGNRISVTVFVFTAITLSIYVWGMFAPLMNLIEGLSQ